MRIYSTLGAEQIIHADGTFDADPTDGSFEVPHHVGAEMLALHADGKRAFEDEPVRHARLTAEARAHREDPATLLSTVEALAEGLKAPDIQAVVDAAVREAITAERERVAAEAAELAALEAATKPDNKTAPKK